MIDCNTEFYNGNMIYTDSGTSSGDGWAYGDIAYVPGPLWVNPPLVGPPACNPIMEQENNRKEINDMIQRQTFLDALTDEGKVITSEERDVIRDAKSDKWALLIACLLARVFESTDLAMLKEKPKEVHVIKADEP